MSEALDKAVQRLARAMAIAQVAFDRQPLSAAMVDIQVNPILNHAMIVKELLAKTNDNECVRLDRTNVIDPATVDLITQFPQVPDTLPDSWRE